jgi:thioredoxin reductase (NADPH)
MKRYDMAVIGTGPAGLSAAINGKIRNKSVLLLGEKDLSRKIGMAPVVENYLGLPKIKGSDLGKAFERHLEALDIEITEAVIKQILPLGDYFSLDTTEGVMEASTVVIGTGVVPNKTMPGEEKYLGNGVGYCATCDGPLYRGRKVAIIGEIEEAERDARYMAELAEKVYYIPGYDGWEERMAEEKAAGQDGVLEIVEGKPLEVEGTEGDEFTRRATALKVQQEDGVEVSLEVDGIFFLKSMIPATSLVPGLQMDEEDAGAIKVDRGMSTNIPGLFAAGDCTGRPYQYMKAAGEGLIAGQAAVAYIDKK